MTFDQDMQTALLEATEDVTGGPDLGRVLREGRSRRRRRAVSTGVAAVTMIGLGAGAAYLLGQGSPHSTSLDPSRLATAPSYRDFVPGTDIDERLQAAVDEDLPGVGPADDVIPLDRDGHRLSDWRDAEQWQASYRVGDGRVFVTTWEPKGSNAVACRTYGHTPEEGQPECTRTPVPSGGYVVSDSFVGVPSHAHNRPRFVFDTSYVGADDSLVRVTVQPRAESWQEAVAGRAYTPVQLRPLLTDPRVAFPELTS